MKYHLRQLMQNDGEDIYEMLQDIPDDENGFKNPIFNKSYEEYQQWLIKCAEDSKKDTLDTEKDFELDDGWGVPKTIFWLYVDDAPVGMCKIRHYLTEALEQDGGHIGYAIRRSARGKGYGKLMMEKLVKEARELGLEKILLTIEPENKASIRMALSQGGKIEKTENGWSYIWVDC